MSRVKIKVHSPTVSFPLENLRPSDVVEYRKDCPVCRKLMTGMTELKNVNGETLFTRGFCRACRFSTLLKGPNSQWLENFYNNKWDTGQPRTGTNDVPLRYLQPFIRDAAAKILDVGCGYGTSIIPFLNAGYKNICGIEHSRKRADYVKSHLQIPVSHCMLENIRDDDIYKKHGPFDAVYLWHVFEHIFDIDRAAREIAAILKPGGALFIAVPYIQTEPTALLAHFFPHLHAFNAENLSLLLETNGLQTKKLDVGMKNGVVICAVKEGQNRNPLPANEKSPYRYINQKMIRDLDLFHVLNQQTGIFIHKYTDSLKGFHYGGRNFFIKDSLYFKLLILLFRVCQNRPGASILDRMLRFLLLRILLMTLAPNDLVTFSMLLSVEDDPALGETIDKFIMSIDGSSIDNDPLTIEFLYPTVEIPIWGK